MQRNFNSEQHQTGGVHGVQKKEDSGVRKVKRPHAQQNRIGNNSAQDNGLDAIVLHECTARVAKAPQPGRGCCCSFVDCLLHFHTFRTAVPRKRNRLFVGTFTVANGGNLPATALFDGDVNTGHGSGTGRTEWSGY